MSKPETFFFSTILAIMIIAIISTLVVQYYDCVNSGGNYVRGLFWYVCLK